MKIEKISFLDQRGGRRSKSCFTVNSGSVIRNARNHFLKFAIAFVYFACSSYSYALKTLDDVEYNYYTYEYSAPIIYAQVYIDGKNHVFSNGVEAINWLMERQRNIYQQNGMTVSFDPITYSPMAGCLGDPAYLNGNPHRFCVTGEVYKNGAFYTNTGAHLFQSFKCSAPYEKYVFPYETTQEGFTNALIACAKLKRFYLVEPNSPPSCSRGGETVGNPIDVLSGIKRQSFVDASVNRVDFVSHYRSEVNAPKSEQGVNWSHSFSSFLNGPKAVGTARFKYSQNLPMSLIGSGKSYPSDACAFAQGLSSPTSTTRLRSSYSYVCDEIDNGQVIKSYAITDSALSPRVGKDVVTVVRETGEYFAFARVQDQWVELSGRSAIAQGFDVTAAETGTITYPDGIQEVFTAGLLTQRRLASGRTLTLSYDAKKLLQEVNEGDVVLYSFAHDEAGYLSSVTFGGGTITYERDGKNNLSRIVQVDGSAKIYHYENSAYPHALTGITDERGVRFATWQYDSQGRAISSEHGNAQEKVTLDYTYAEDATAPRIITTNPLGKQTVYHLQSVNGSKKIDSVEGYASDNCAAASRDYDYFPDGNLSSKTDWEGNTTLYQRDVFGREISRTEAAGTPAARTTLTEYHPTLNLPVKITEGDQVTVLSYDAAGRLLSKTQQSTVAP